MNTASAQDPDQAQQGGDVLLLCGASWREVTDRCRPALDLLDIYARCSIYNEQCAD